MSKFRSKTWSVMVAIDFPCGVCYVQSITVTACDPDGACVEARRQVLAENEGKVKAGQVRIERVHLQKESRRRQIDCGDA